MILKGAIHKKSRFLSPISSNTDTLGWRADLSYNPKASIFDESGMRHKNQPFIQIAQLME